MLENFDAVSEVDQAIKCIAGGVLEPIFMPDFLSQCGIGACFRREPFQPFDQRGMTAPERLTTGRVGRIEPRTVSQDDPHVTYRTVTVLRRTAAHARGVIGGDAAYHATIYRSRIGANFAPIGKQQLIGSSTDDSRLQ